MSSDDDDWDDGGDEEYEDNEDNEDNEDDLYSQEGREYTNFQPEINAWDRVGLPGQGLGVPQNRIERAMMDPLERFHQYVDATARNLDISNSNILSMLNNAKKIEDIGYKNPTAYVLGFLATGEGRKLTKDNFDRVVNKVLPYVKDGSVLPPDIIRYARLWESLSR